MIEEKDIKVGNIVYMDEKQLLYDSEDNGLWKHVSSSDFTLLSESPSKVSFEILEVKDSVCLRPTSTILLPNYNKFDKVWVWKDMFKRDYSLALSNGAEKLCEYPSDKLISIIEDAKTAKFALLWIYDVLVRKQKLKDVFSFPLEEFNDEFTNTIFCLIVDFLKKGE